MKKDKNKPYKDKKEYLNIIVQAAKLYQANLLGNNMLIIYKGQEKQYFYIEVLFEKKHFLHLTGVKPVKGILSTDFYERCISGRLSVNDFEVNDTWTTTKKMNVILHLMNISKNSRIVGNFKGNGSASLYTEKLVGGERGCMGFVCGEVLNGKII